MRPARARDSNEVSVIRPARPEEAAFLTALAFRSKAYWGYDIDFMEACRGALTLTSDVVARGVVRVLEAARDVVGFYSLAPWRGDIELLHFFVDPAAMGNGVGRRLLTDALDRASKLGYRRLLIQADPNAEGFYLKLGAERIGQVPSEAIAGRELPLLIFQLGAAGSAER